LAIVGAQGEAIDLLDARTVDVEQNAARRLCLRGRWAGRRRRAAADQ
jgi:hypothetical protein